MKTKQRTINYPDFDLPCELCGKRFKTPQGLYGHRRFVHGPASSEGPAPVIDKTSPDGSAEPSVKELKGQVERLELEVKRRKLQAEFPSTSARPADIMEQSGLGSLEGESKQLAQRRAMGQEQQPSWIDKIISNPEALKMAIMGLKGILGVDNRGNGDNTAELLKSLGFNLKDLILGATAPKSGSFEIAGMNLAGVSMTPQLLSSLLDYKAKTESAQKVYEGQTQMADTLKGVFKTVGEGIASGAFGKFGKSGPGRNSEIISQEIMTGSGPAGFKPFTCPKCQTENTIPAEAQPGTKIKCQGEGCEEVYTVIDLAQQKPEREKKTVEVEPIVEQTTCPCCGQLLDLAGRSIGEVVRCSVCGDELTVKSDTLAVPAQEPLSESEKEQGKFLRQ